MWEAAILIATVVGAVHFVHRYAFKQGIDMGIMVGRKEILEENIQRAIIMERDNYDLMTLVEQIADGEIARNETRLITHNKEASNGYQDAVVIKEGRG